MAPNPIFLPILGAIFHIFGYFFGGGRHLHFSYFFHFGPEEDRVVMLPVQEFHDRLFHGGGLSKKGKGTNRTGGSAILKPVWGGNLLYFPAFADLQP